MTDPSPNTPSSTDQQVTSALPWFRSSVVYQIYPRSFADGNGDGIGDLAGITSRLDHLADLGVDVVWLSPIYRSPQDDNGYDISDYEDIDPLFGTLDDFDEMLAAMHARGIKLVMDLVVNHTSDEHAWFEESRSSKDHPKRDWYWWRPAREGFEPGTPGAEPNNWGSAFSGSAWQFDELTGEYFLHLFSKKQPDLNWEHPDVRAAVYRMMNWWLDRGVDGFRMDVINLISKDTSLPDDVKREGALWGAGHRYYVNGPRIHEFLQEMHREVFAGRTGQLLTVGETPGARVRDAQLFTDPARCELDMIFQFEHMDVVNGSGKWDLVPFDLRKLKASLGRWQVGLAESGWNSLYWNNHDQPRVVSRFGDDGAHRVASAKMLGTVLHLHRGTPYVYQGEEIGMTNVPFRSIDDFRDLESINHFDEAVGHGADPAGVLHALRTNGRDNARTPMQWDASAHAGFTSAEPWIPVNPNHVEVNVAAAVADPDSVLHHYRRLIALRRSDATVQDGDFCMLLDDHPAIYAFLRRLDGDELLVLGNFSADRQAVALDDAAEWAVAEVVIRSDDPSGATLLDPAATAAIELGPWASLVLRRRPS